MAGLLALGWGALLRTSEITGSLRKDLVLPIDTLGTNNFALLSLVELNTRFVTARHQSAKLDIPDLLRLVELSFAEMKAHQRLWPFSTSTFRLRFNDLLGALLLQTGALHTLDAGSLRPGGATRQVQHAEDSEFVRRRETRALGQRKSDGYIYISRKLDQFNFCRKCRSCNVDVL